MVSPHTAATEDQTATTRPRRGLVLGGGGVLGAAWTIGALVALRDALGVEPRTFDHIVGISAGSVLASLLGAGVDVDDLRDHQFGSQVDRGPLAGNPWDYEAATGGPRPPRPKLAPGAPKIVLQKPARLRELPTTAVVSALLPEGRGSLAGVGELVESVTPAGAWSPHPALWVMATDYETGERVAFGREDAPPATLADAVTASCAIPGWFAPMVIDGRRYIDGGAYSATSVDVLAGHGLDEVFVLASMVSTVRSRERPRKLARRLEQRWRDAITRRCLDEIAVLEAEGTHVTVMSPGRTDRAAIGTNLMNLSRRTEVLTTSLRTSAEQLAARRELRDAAIDPTTNEEP